MELVNTLIKIKNVEACACGSAKLVHYPVPRLDEVLRWKNGFYAYNRGLHVFGDCDDPPFHSLQRWNAPDGWIKDYGNLAQGLFFFAEDTFGDQFAWDGSQVVRFVAETGEREILNSDLVAFFKALVLDPDGELGLAVLDDWIKVNGPVPEGKHLFPSTPIVLGGSLDPSQIVPIDPFENMRFKADIATQIADVPDGERIRLRFPNDKP
jgi:hypothetical protein